MPLLLGPARPRAPRAAGLLQSLAGGAAGDEPPPLDYLAVLAVRDHLAAAPEAQRGLFGGLAGPAAEWDRIARAYERDSVWLAEAARGLCQLADFELPFLRKQAAKLEQTASDHERRGAELVRGAAAAAAAYAAACAELGVSGADARAELLAQTRQTPALFEAALAGLRAGGVRQAAERYAAFAAAVHGAAPGPPLLPVLTEVLDGTTAEWRGGGEPGPSGSEAAAGGAAAGVIEARAVARRRARARAAAPLLPQLPPSAAAAPPL
jgi:hypothetical protein